jgi:hypothetical protein
MECLHKSPGSGAMDTPVAQYDREKIAKIRKKIAVVFGRASTLDDAAISERYNITPDGDLIMMLK